MTSIVPKDKLTRKDFTSDQEVRWCPGCGDYAILATVQRLMPEFGVSPDDMVWVSGIGCSSRFPYYMQTYGFHTIHGRAPAFATGIKVANPALQVWQVTGDGDGLSIGGNHLIHVLRRNVDINLLMFNNRIYGLTKGQYSPTSELGKRTKSTPMGSADYPLEPGSLALGAGAAFFARAIATEAKQLSDVLVRAQEHRGTSFVEIYQNCNVFNDGAFDAFTEKKNAADNQLHVVHGQPLLFGKDNEKGLRLDPKTFSLSVAEVGKDGVSESDILVHDETNLALASMLTGLPFPQFPVALGVIYCRPRETYDVAVHAQVTAAKAKNRSTLLDLLHSGETWTVS